jgi:hypothetical protein
MVVSTFLHGRRMRGDTIAVMAKYRPAKGKSRNARPPQNAIGCVVLVILGMFLVMLFLYYTMTAQ